MNEVDRGTRTTWSRRRWRLVFLSGALIIVVALFFVYVFTRQATAVRTAVGEAEATSAMQAAVTSALVERIESDIPALVALPVVESLLADPSNELAYSGAVSALSAFVAAKQIYNQARIIDRAGHELVRGNRLGSRAEVAPPSQLQDKSGRYYVREGLVLERDSWYVSAFDLNMENGRIEEPRIPMIRLAAPVYVDGNVAGLVVLNLLGDVILESFREASASLPGVVALADENGWWLFVDDPAREWGNMYPDREIDSVPKTLGSLWTTIRSLAGVTHVNRTHIVSTRRIAPFPGASRSSNVGNWYVVYQVSTRELGVDRLSVMTAGTPVFLVAFALLAAAAWLLADATFDRNRYRAHIERAAYLDELTGVPNRRYLMDQLVREIDLQKRYGRHFSILFLDLDGFKAVNDRIGHEAGDEVLRIVAQRIRESIRKSDTVARLGGDEFVVVLVGSDDRRRADSVAGKILREIQKPIPLSGGEARVGTSIGVALTGDLVSAGGPEEVADQLLSTADRAMYDAKRAGKNRIVWAET